MDRGMKYAHLLSDPLLPLQTGGNAGLQRGEPSGEVLCPRKKSLIGVMRCGEYQDADGCGAGCSARAAAEDVARARAEVECFTSGAGRGSYTCLRCGGPKLYLKSGMCMSCGNVESNKHNHRGRGL